MLTAAEQEKLDALAVDFARFGYVTVADAYRMLVSVLAEPAAARLAPPPEGDR